MAGKREIAVATRIRKRIISLARYLGRFKTAERLELEGVEGYPSMDEFDVLDAKLVSHTRPSG